MRIGSANRTTRWSVASTARLEDKFGSNIYPNKEKVENKIDGVVALIIALNRAINEEIIGP